MGSGNKKVFDKIEKICEIDTSVPKKGRSVQLIKNHEEIRVMSNSGTSGNNAANGADQDSGLTGWEGIPQGKEFSTKYRQCVGLLLLCIVKAAGGADKEIAWANLWPFINQWCRLNDKVPPRGIGRYLKALQNQELVNQKNDKVFSVSNAVFHSVLSGGFGPLPYEVFGFTKTEQPTPKSTISHANFSLFSRRNKPDEPVKAETQEKSKGRRVIRSTSLSRRAIPADLEELLRNNAQLIQELSERLNRALSEVPPPQEVQTPVAKPLFGRYRLKYPAVRRGEYSRVLGELEDLRQKFAELASRVSGLEGLDSDVGELEVRVGQLEHR